MALQIPTNNIVLTETVKKDSDYHGLRIVRYQTEEKDHENFDQIKFEFQHNTGLTAVKAMLTKKGAVKTNNYRLVATLNLSLQDFVNIVRYDPANPPVDNYEALGMITAHEQTQSDFKGAKKTNAADFMQYLVESVTDDRVPYLPVIAGWQGIGLLDETVFVAYDEEDPDSMYGMLYLPKKPVMQSDGQTQTGALFAFANSEVGQANLDSFMVSLEVELGVEQAQAGQSFADRNGRGTKKNKNLVIGLDVSAPISKLREAAIKQTIFEGRVAKGRGANCTVTATQNIVDLSTLEQMLLAVVSDGLIKPEHFKPEHTKHFAKYVKEFIALLEECFGSQWKSDPGSKEDTFRRLYVHGWPFALKAIASAYHKVRINELGPLTRATRTPIDSALDREIELEKNIAKEKDNWVSVETLSFDEFQDRLNKINWERQKKHWIDITGCAKTKNQKNRVYALKSGKEVVVARAQNQQVLISDVQARILSDQWKSLCGSEDAPL